MIENANSVSVDNLFWRIVVNDDEVAFRSLFYSFFPSLCVFAGRYIEDRDECEDIVQETFFKIWRNRKSIQITSSARNLLVTSVRNSCIDFLRKKELEYAYMDRQAHKEWLTDPEEIYSITELEEMLGSALQLLPSNLREVFVMNRFDGFTYVEIAEKQKISVKTVEAYMSKALKLLRVELKDYLPFVLLLISRVNI